MAKAQTQEKPQETKVIRPSELADMLQVDAKAVRSFLRSTFPRPIEAKGTTWTLTDEQTAAVIAHFEPSEDDTEDGES